MKLVKTAIEIHIYMRMKINHRRQIWDILVRFRATPKLCSIILVRENKSPAANLGQLVRFRAAPKQLLAAKLLSALELQNIELIK